ncbi:hypothetical protein AAG906_020785 [Vitis piasezkii]
MSLLSSAWKVKETGGRKTRLLCLIYGGIFLEWNLGRGGSHTLERRGSERRRTFEFYWPRSKGTVSLYGFGSVSVWKLGESALWIVVGSWAAHAIDWVFMPSKPLPWDRKDFFKERKHERSESLGLLQDRGTHIKFLGSLLVGIGRFSPPYR